MITVAVVGLGQIGGSLAAALTRRRLARVIGVTRRAATARRARRMGILAGAGTDLAAVAEADITVLATPVRTLLQQVPGVAARVRPGSVLTDVGSTKAEVLAALRRARTGASIIAGHPMAGNERAGLDGCDPDLFERRPWVLIAAPGTPAPARARMERLVRGVGSHPVWMTDPLEHDLRVARISHVPYLLAYALARQPDDTLRVCGNSFRDATRVALSDVDMVLDFFLTNRGPIRRAAAEMRRRFDELLRLLARGDEGRLRARLEEARSRRARV